MSNFVKWIKEYSLDCKSLDSENLNYFQIDGVGRFLLIKEKPDRVFSESLALQFSSTEKALVDVDYYVYPFGGQFYYTPKGTINPPQFKLFKYLGKFQDKTEIEMAYLGIHGEYELLNGSRMYDDWVQKAVFLGYKTLGLCERNTLAGTLPFQLVCKSVNIKSILGEEVTVKLDETTFVDCKLYVQTKTGWENLLLINSQILVFNEKKFVDLVKLKEYSEGLVLVVGHNWSFSKHLLILKDLLRFFTVYYQIDTVEYSDNEKDEQYLLKMKEYLDNYYNLIKPVLINDTYYLDKVDAFIKDELNTISGHKIQPSSESQYFKSVQDNFYTLNSLFQSEDERFLNIFSEAIENVNKIANDCDFVIETGKRLLPKFSLEGLKEEYQQCETTEDLFWYLIEKGIETRLKGKDLQPYVERIEKEYKVIKSGDVVDYFLILWDIVQFCKDSNILVGIGRGSSGGSLLAYLLNITNLDPLRFGLLFERFLNEGRVQTTPPDIDQDIESSRKEEVKRYVSQRYGEDYFCSVGTYTRLQMKASIKDLGKVRGIPQQILNYLNKLINSGTRRYGISDWEFIFTEAVEKPQIKAFIQNNPEFINDIHLIIGQARSASIHPCATIILPQIRVEGDKYPVKDLFNTIPIKMVDGALVAEWEGEYLEKVGYLKEDLLGLIQLDKFHKILDLIKGSENIDIDIYSISLDDRRVFSYFKKGWNGDVFQFNTPGLTGYCLDVKPETIEDLFAILAVYRPGPMYVKAHLDYVELKHGKKQPHYDFGLKEVTKSTYGLYIYQEQIMQATVTLGGFSLVEADNIRKAMGKMDSVLIAKSEKKFVQGAMVRGCPEDEAKEIWHKLEVFADYGFNLSHSAAYAITAYICQYLKVYYPIQYWTAALQLSSEEDIPKYISELSRSNSKVKLRPPSVNFSGFDFFTDFKTETIYWSLTKIKNVGQVAGKSIVEDREKTGSYYSFSEFLTRSNKTAVDKTVVTCLVLSGVFDEMEFLEHPHQRYKLLDQYYTFSKRKKTEGLDTYEKFASSKYDYWWTLKQKELCGLGYIDFHNVLKNISKTFKDRQNEFIDVVDLYTSTGIGKKGIVGGVVLSVKEKTSKKGQFGEVSLQCNDDTITVTIWTETWNKYRTEVVKSTDKILLVTGEISRYHGNNTIQTMNSSKVEVLD